MSLSERKLFNILDFVWFETLICFWFYPYKRFLFYDPSNIFCVFLQYYKKNKHWKHQDLLYCSFIFFLSTSPLFDFTISHNSIWYFQYFLSLFNRLSIRWIRRFTGLGDCTHCYRAHTIDTDHCHRCCYLHAPPIG